MLVELHPYASYANVEEGFSRWYPLLMSWCDHIYVYVRTQLVQYSHCLLPHSIRMYPTSVRNSTDDRTRRCGWWMNYQNLVGEELHSRPRGATIVEPTFMAQSFKTSITAATDCPSSPSCQCGAFPDVVVYSKMLADEVEKAIETVSYEYTNQHDTQLVPSHITGSRIVHHPAVKVIGVVEVDYRGFWELVKNARVCFDAWE
jgi:hypothetical protein